MVQEEKNRQIGMAAAIGACFMWGILPIYWKLLRDASAYEILAHRICWSFIFMLAVIFLFRRGKKFVMDCKEIWQDKKRKQLLLSASLLISINWLTYIWAVNHDHVIETSIGYYITPLMSVLLGMVIFHEKLILGKKISIVLAFIGIVIMTWQFGQVPWISVILAVSFAIYGALKKKMMMDPITSITLETLLVMPLALVYIGYLWLSGASHFGGMNWTLTLFLIGAGIVTATPLILFSQGANLLPLNVLGFLQYIGPTIALFLGVFLFKEVFNWTHMIAFSFIWAALVIFSLSERFAIPQSKPKRKKTVLQE